MTHAYSTILSPRVADKVAVGTVQILESPHVSEGPGRIANAPVPSVFHDDRGSIHRLKVGNQRINLSFSGEGVMRSGYFHNLEKSVSVLSGEVEIWLLKDDVTDKIQLKNHQSFAIRPYVPHIFHFPSGGAVLAEWWEPSSTTDLQCWFYHPYRRIVDVQNSLVSRSTGHHALLVPQDVEKLCQTDAAQPSVFRGFLSWTTGLVMGVAIGAVVTSRHR